MCGIAGVLYRDGRTVVPAELRTAGEEMVHRGPDDHGFWHEGALGLVHRRLSILDLSPLGHQPMMSNDERFVMVFNGEIFNFIELRAELEAQGERFRSQSDTEVLLRLWQLHGVGCVDRLIGMFAFAIWDRVEKTLDAVRDRLGIKPFFYCESDGAFRFGSEIKTILAASPTGPLVDPMGMADFQFVGYPMGERTLFAGIRQLPPGHRLHIGAEGIRISSYWSVQYAYDRSRNHDETVEVLRDVLDSAVHMHCRSDAPLGCHLSGGLDSSTVALLASDAAPGLSTFSIRFGKGNEFDESRYATAVAQAIGSRHHEDEPTLDRIDQLLAFLTYHIEQPITASAVAYFAAARLAARYVTVALTGHGGDEVFGGYAAQFAVGMRGAGPAIPSGGQSAVSVLQRLAFAWRAEGVQGLIRRLRGSEPLSVAGVDAQWLMAHCELPEARNHPALSATFKGTLNGYSPVGAFLHEFSDAPTDELFDRCLHHDLRHYLPSLLHVEDRTSMAVSIESRVPLLDHRVVEFAATVPPEVKIPGRYSKQLLRTLTASRLPDIVRLRTDKGAFPVPTTRWMRNELYPYARALLLDDRTLSRGVYRPSWIRACLASRERLWPLVAHELWARIFLDRDPAVLADVAAYRAALGRSLVRPA